MNSDENKTPAASQKQQQITISNIEIIFSYIPTWVWHGLPFFILLYLIAGTGQFDNSLTCAIGGKHIVAVSGYPELNFRSHTITAAELEAYRRGKAENPNFADQTLLFSIPNGTIIRVDREAHEDWARVSLFKDGIFYRGWIYRSFPASSRSPTYQKKKIGFPCLYSTN